MVARGSFTDYFGELPSSKNSYSQECRWLSQESDWALRYLYETSVFSTAPYHYVVGGLFYNTERKLKTNLEVMQMAGKKQSAAVPVKDGLFFPEDFTKLHRRHAIYIKQGVIIDLDKL